MVLFLLVDGRVAEDVFLCSHELLAILVFESFDMVTDVGRLLVKMSISSKESGSLSQ